MPPPALNQTSRAAAAWTRWLAYAVFVLAVCLRFTGLANQSLWLDELWGLEIAAGHGAEHQVLPTGQVLVAPPDLTSMSTAGPAWRVWTGLDRVTGPPGSYLLLRAWADLFGESEPAVRSLSAVCSAAAVVLLFLAVRTAAGSGPALWAAALMAVAGPQVRAAQDARPYAPLLLLGTAALWLVARTVTLGPTCRRSTALTAVLLAMLMTHYFAVPAVAAVGVYGLVCARGSTRRHLTTAVIVAGFIFAVAWGPFMWRQLAAFSPTDRAAAFLREAGPGHFRATVWRALTLPASMLVDARPVPRWYAAVGAIGWAAVLFHRRLPAVWPLWFVGTVALLVTLDLTRSTAHLNYLRYALLAAPAVYAALAVLPSTHHRAARTAGRAATAAAVAFAAWSLPLAYRPGNEDFRSLDYALRGSIRPGDLVVFAGPAATFSPQIAYLAAAHYAGPLPGPVVLLESPATPALQRQIGPRPTIWMVAAPKVLLARQWLPGYHLAVGRSWPVVGSLLRMDRDR